MSTINVKHITHNLYSIESKLYNTLGNVFSEYEDNICHICLMSLFSTSRFELFLESNQNNCANNILNINKYIDYVLSLNNIFINNLLSQLQNDNDKRDINKISKK